MKVKVDFVTNLPFEVGTPIITLYPQTQEELENEVVVNYIDGETGNLIETRTLKQKNKPIVGIRQYYTKWKIVFKDTQNNIIHTHSLDLENKVVFIKMDARALGDNLAWIDYVEQFRVKHNCRVICSTFWNDLFINTYPDIMFVAPNTKIHNVYAQYYIGTSNFVNLTYQPSLYLNNPLQKIASDILGLEYVEAKPRIDYPLVPRKKKVCISEYASLKVKDWNVIGGWQAVVDLFVSYGYEVVVISKEPSYLKNVTNKSGDYPLTDRIQDLAESQFFVGNSSGLSWLAWGCDVHVILISDFTPPYHEPTQNYTRVYNKEYPRDIIKYEEVLHPVSKEDVLQTIEEKIKEYVYVT
jgi:autotransporter strand-loop-strand O-heptosyltransferase